MSELHTVLTSGFSTIAGTVMAAYISFGVSPGTVYTWDSKTSATPTLGTAKWIPDRCIFFSKFPIPDNVDLYVLQNLQVW